MVESAATRRLSRRSCLGVLAGGALGAACWRTAWGDDTPGRSLPPVRAITKGPRRHWFGYYDKHQFDPTNRLVLGMAVDFEHRSPRGDDAIEVGMIDLDDGDRWTRLGESRAWGWQQGCMLQWVPGTESTVLWNDRVGDRFVCRIHDVRSGEQRMIDRPIYTLSPDGRSGLSLDFARLNDMRPGYGYSGGANPTAGDLAPADSGIWNVDLASGKSELVVSLGEIVKSVEPSDDMRDAAHWFNHLLFNTDGARFEFLHRWRPKGAKSWRTRMLTAAPDGSDLWIVDRNGFTSHFIWRDPEHILAYSRPTGRPAGFYLFRDRADDAELIGGDVMTADGHCTYLPGNEWILNDTYPDKDRLQHPYLYRVATGERVPLGHFLSPPEYTGEWRCDTHPRTSRDGRSVVIDSPHTGEGRQMHLIDVSGILG